jgi:hypothetical protein
MAFLTEAAEALIQPIHLFWAKLRDRGVALEDLDRPEKMRLRVADWIVVVDLKQRLVAVVIPGESTLQDHEWMIAQRDQLAPARRREAQTLLAGIGMLHAAGMILHARRASRARRLTSPAVSPR